MLGITDPPPTLEWIRWRARRARRLEMQELHGEQDEDYLDDSDQFELLSDSAAKSNNNILTKLLLMAMLIFHLDIFDTTKGFFRRGADKKKSFKTQKCHPYRSLFRRG